MKPAGRQRILLVALGLIATVVVLEFAGLLPRAGDSEADASDASARSLYLQRIALVEDQERLIGEAPRWRALADELRVRWDRAKEGLVSGATEQLAGAAFRDAVVDALAGLDLTAVAATLQPASPVDPLIPVRLLTLEVRFDAKQHRDLYAAIERLENLPGVRTSIASVRIDGPGRLQISGEARVSLTVRALAVIGEESAQ